MPPRQSFLTSLKIWPLHYRRFGLPLLLQFPEMAHWEIWVRLERRLTLYPKGQSLSSGKPRCQFPGFLIYFDYHLSCESGIGVF